MGGNTAPQAGAKAPAWQKLKHGQHMSGLGLTPVVVTFLGEATDFRRHLFSTQSYALVGEWQLVAAELVSDTLVAGTAGDLWVFSIRNVGTGGDTDALSSGYSTLVDGALVARNSVSIPIDGPGNKTPTNVFMGENESLELFADTTGGDNLSTVRLTVTLYFLQAPPSRTGLQQ